MYKAVPIVAKMLEALEVFEINYCHFKSNEHLGPAIIGDTDLDMLFANADYEKVKNLLLELGFQKCNTAWYVSYPYVEDYIAIEGGKIIHVHAHFRLILGESKVKSYIIPWEKEILTNRSHMGEYGIYVSNPIHEMLLLIIRTSLKLPFTDSNYQSKRDVKDAVREFDWLKGRVSKNEIIEFAKLKFGSLSETPIIKIYDENINYKNIKQFIKVTKKELNTFRRYSFIQSKLIKFIRQFAIALSILNKKFNLFSNIKNHRTLSKKGIIVSLMGSDGSGKSTQVALLKTILLKKIDVRYLYMGSGDGHASWHRNLLKFGMGLIKSKKLISVAYKDKKSSVFSFLKTIYLISLAVEKRTKLRQLNSYRKKGMISITDRYPQTQIYGYNDGLHLSDWLNSSNIFLRALADFEHKCYNLSNEIKPDLVVKLIADSEVLNSRRSEMTKKEIEKKQDGIKNMFFDQSVDVVELDATLSKDEVTTLILDKISHKLIESK